MLSEGSIMASEDTDDQLSEASSSSGLLCIHCNEDEVKWACNDCSREFCDRCKRIHLIADEETRDHHLYRYGSKRVSGPNVPDVIHHSALSVNEARRPRVKFKPVVERRVSEFKPKASFAENSTVQHIRIVPRGNGDAWLKCGAISEELVSHDTEGTYLQRIRADSVIQDFVVTSKSEIIFSKIHSKALWIHTTKGQIKPLLQLEFFPNCLYLTVENDLLICALSTQQCRGSPLIKLSRSSQKSVIQVDQGLNLGDVYDMSQSANDTICLVEKGGWGPGRVVGLDEDGGRVFEYRGPSGSLNPSGIACDHFGFIYVSDCGCHNVHVITQTGKFHSFLLPLDSVQLPEAIDVGEDGDLWLGNGNGEIKVYKLETEAS